MAEPQRYSVMLFEMLESALMEYQEAKREKEEAWCWLQRCDDKLNDLIEQLRGTKEPLPPYNAPRPKSRIMRPARRGSGPVTLPLRAASQRLSRLAQTKAHDEPAHGHA